MICAQGGEAGGHTGDIPFSILIPSVVDLCSKAKTLKGDPVLVVAAGGIADGRGLAAALVYVSHKSVFCLEDKLILYVGMAHLVSGSAHASLHPRKLARLRCTKTSF